MELKFRIKIKSEQSFLCEFNRIFERIVEYHLSCTHFWKESEVLILLELTFPKSYFLLIIIFDLKVFASKLLKKHHQRTTSALWISLFQSWELCRLIQFPLFLCRFRSYVEEACICGKYRQLFAKFINCTVSFCSNP